MKSASDIINEHYNCTCHEAYSSRKMVDPSCVLHEQGDEIELMMEEYAKQQAIDYAHWCFRRLRLVLGENKGDVAAALFDEYLKETQTK